MKKKPRPAESRSVSLARKLWHGIRFLQSV